MSAPERVRLKRKRTENPPDHLVLARPDDLDASSPSKRIRYVIQDAVTPSEPLPAPSVHTRRIFHITRKRSAIHLNGQDGSKRLRNNEVPTVQERLRHIPGATAEPEEPAAQSDVRNETPMKRPGRGSALPVKGIGATKSNVTTPSAKVDSLAESMHRFALEQIAASAKPSSMSKPRMSAAQSRARHEQRIASGGPVASETDDSAMDLDEDFVYDTYILSSDDAGDVEMGGDVAFLVINDDDDAYWHELLAQAEAEELENSDEEDENAEDHYGADYPEDELASDDEFDKNAYNFRPRANSDVEQWDHREEESEDCGSTTDDDGLGEYDNYGNKGRMIKKWETELGIHRPHADTGARQ